MKKILSLVLALALCLSLGVVAFAADTSSAYDSDGEVSGDATLTQWELFGKNSTATLTLDPIRPASTVYIWLGDMGTTTYNDIMSMILLTLITLSTALTKTTMANAGQKMNLCCRRQKGSVILPAPAYPQRSN